MAYYPVDRANVVSKGLHAPKPGLNSVGEYQVAGRPYIKTLVNADISVNILTNTSTAADDNTITFPFVTSRIVIQNTGDVAIVAYFCSTSVEDADSAGDSAVKVNKNYFVIPAKAAGASPSVLDLKIKTKKLYIAGYGGTGLGASPKAISIAAELTNIEEPYDCDVDNIDGISG